MKRPSTAFTIVVSGSLIVLALTAMGAYAVWEGLGGLCGNTILAEALSPDQRHKAVVFRRDCGATTGFSTQVSVIGAQEALPHASGNVFTADDNRGAVPTSAPGGPMVQVRWASDVSLVVSYSVGARAYVQEAQVRGVRVMYEPL